MITDGKPSITSINNFLGLNMNATGETQLKLGEASYMKNFRITKDYKLEKMFGYHELYKPNKPIQGNWIGKLGDTEMNIYVADKKAYKGGTTPTELGSFTVDKPTTIFEFNKVLYFLNGSDLKSYDGTTFGNVDAYIPTIKISCTPAGVGEDYEPINMLTASRKVSFSGDGTSTVYQLPETVIESATAKVGGVETEVTLNSANGTVTFATAPTSGTDNVIVTYVKQSVTTMLDIKRNKYAQKYGLANDTRVFLYGNEQAKNRIYFSDLDNTGTPNVTYFPATNFIDVGSSNTEVTDISRQYDRLIISKPSEAYYATYSPITDTEGNTIVTFPVYPLNDAHGMVAYGKGQVLDNYVTTIDASGIIQWVNTQSKDERNASVISGRVNEWLQERDLSKAITMDYQEEKEYWIAIGNEVLVYNYANSTFYILNFPDTVYTLRTYKGLIYMGTETSIMEFGKGWTAYNGEIIDAEWHGGYYDFEAEYKRKTMRILWITVKPQENTYMAVNYITDRNEGTDPKEILRKSFSYNLWNYADFMYTSGTQVKPFRIKLKAKKFAFMKLILKSNKIDCRLIVDSISIQKSYGGFVK